MTYGACFGDAVGAPSEFSGAPRDVATMELARSDYDCTDDSILTCTVAKALTDWDGRDDDAFVELLSRRFVVDVHDYPDVSWGGRFVEWALAGGHGSYGSFGNGSAMRVSPVAWWASDEAEVLRLARLTALPTHSHPEGIRGAQAVALAVFMARMGSSKQKIRAALEARFDGDDGAFPTICRAASMTSSRPDMESTRPASIPFPRPCAPSSMTPASTMSRRCAARCVLAATRTPNAP